ncbi:MAG: 4Fe-4S binding protein [Leptothrix sp. (in: b-proteobacteria)]
MQRRRRIFQGAFFALFLLAPITNLLRFDLTETQLWFLGRRWSLGLDAFVHGQASVQQTALSMLLNGLLPLLLLVGGGLYVAWRWGRLYCGWLCPHFSLVELLNDLLHRAIGRFSVWERHATPRAGRAPQSRWLPVFVLACVLLGALWAVTLLSYLLPPIRLWQHIFTASTTPAETRFLLIGTAVFALEFGLARHLFCRFGCAVGLFQSLAWIANPRAMVVSFSRGRARECRTCAPPQGSACDSVCPMRLHPRNIKRMMFSCVQCGQCLTACDDSQGAQQRSALLAWHDGALAEQETRHAKRAQAPEPSPQPSQH